MTAARTERLMDVLFVLLNASTPITREQIRQRVPGYDQGSDEAFQRMFERDKDALRDMGVPIELKNFDAVHDDVQGYWLDRKTWLLPDLKLTADERLMITLAASAWEDQQLTSVAREAAHRMGSMALRPHDGPDMRIGVGQTKVAELFDAITNKRVVTFAYESKSSQTVSDRVVEPWRLLLTGGAWYLVGFDEEREALRTFRLSRIVSAISVTNRSCVHDMPDDLDLAELVQSWSEIPGAKSTAVVRIDPGTCSNLRLRAKSVESTDTYDELTIEFGHKGRLLREVAAVCQYVQSVSPSELNADIANYIRQAIAVNS